METVRNSIAMIILFAVSVTLLGIPTTNTNEEYCIYIDEIRGFTHRPEDPVYLSVADDYIIIRVRVLRDLMVSNIKLVTPEQEITMKPQLYLVNAVIWFGIVKYNGKDLMYHFSVEFINGTVVKICHSQVEKNFHFNGEIKHTQISWISRGVGYQIFPDRFYNGDPGNDHYGQVYDSLLYDNTTTMKPVLSKWNDPPHNPLHCCHQYFGGDIRGIIMKLDYLKELGVGLIYLNPIFLCGSVHCYDTYDYYKIHPRLGTIEDLQELLEKAHEKGIHVIFDFVPGHVGLGFWAFQDVYINGPYSSYWNWFTIYTWPFIPGDGRHYRCWWGFGSLPQLNTTNPIVKEYLINVTLYWLDLGFDGVRIDTPLDLLNPREFFNELRSAIKSKYPDKYIVGEIWEVRPEWVNAGPFDSLMNYALGKDILLEYAKGGYQDNIAYILSYYYSTYSITVAGMGFNIVGSHDTDRVLTMLNGGRLFPEQNPPPESITRLKLLSTLQYTQPGVPVIFQGDERGIPGIKTYPWEEHRYPIQWDRLNQEVFEHYKKLGWLKTNLKSLHTSMIRVFETSGGILAYTRGYNDEILVLANNKKEPVVFELPQELASINWTIMYSSSTNDSLIEDHRITIPPITAIILLNKAYLDELGLVTNETKEVITQVQEVPIPLPIVLVVFMVVAIVFIVLILLKISRKLR